MVFLDGVIKKYDFRQIKQEELQQVIEIEQICFPPNEACSPENMRDRVLAAPELFLVAVDKETGKVAGFLNGLATDECVFRDEFFTDASLHKKDGQNVMLCGLDVLPQHRRQGLARELTAQYAEKERENGRELLLLTCLESKVEMYEKFGFEDRGISGSVWGGEVWHEMAMKISEG